MTGQLDLFGAPSADAAERPAAGKGRASARPEPAPAPPDPCALVNLLALDAPEKQNPSREGFDSAAEAAGGGELDSSTPAPASQDLVSVLREYEPAADIWGQPLSVPEALAAIAELIREPARWCQGCSARDAAGKPTIPGSTTAVRLSAYGAFALLVDRGRITANDALRLWLVLDGSTPDGKRFARWHDAPAVSHADVIGLLLKAVAGEP